VNGFHELAIVCKSLAFVERDHVSILPSRQCYFKDKSALASLSKGQSITVKDTMQDMSLGMDEMKDYSLVQ
jgi:hypothetical protein